MAGDAVPAGILREEEERVLHGVGLPAVHRVGLVAEFHIVALCILGIAAQMGGLVFGRAVVVGRSREAIVLASELLNFCAQFFLDARLSPPSSVIGAGRFPCSRQRLSQRPWQGVTTRRCGHAANGSEHWQGARRGPLLNGRR